MALKQYIGSKNLVDSLQRIDVKYIIDRSDIYSTRQDKKSLDFLTNSFFNPVQPMGSICESLKYDDLHVTCLVQSSLQDMSEVQNIRLDFKSDVAGYIEVVLVDQYNNQPRWNGEKEQQLRYSIEDIGQVKTIDLSLFNPTENPDTDFTSIRQVEIYFRPRIFSDNINFQVISLGVVKGEKQLLDSYHKIVSLDGLKIYGPNQSGLINPVRAFAQIAYTDSYDQLFDSFKHSSETAYLFKSSKLDESLTEIPLQTEIQTIKMNQNKYFVTLPKAGNYFLRLNQNFNSEWKVKYLNSSSHVSLTFFDQLALFLSSDVDSNKHFLTDGYANGWLIKAQNPIQIVIVYKPQILLDILWTISFGFFGFLICLVIGFYVSKNKTL
jgi:hypothetical protein